MWQLPKTARYGAWSVRVPQQTNIASGIRREVMYPYPRSAFSRFAKWMAHATGHPLAFVLAAATIVVWLVTGPIFGFSDTWQLVINTGMAFIGTTSNAPPASTSARTSHAASKCSRIQPFRLTPTLLPTNQSPTVRRLTLRPTSSKLSTTRATGNRLGKCRPANARLGQACGLPTFPQTDGGGARCLS